MRIKIFVSFMNKFPLTQSLGLLLKIFLSIRFVENATFIDEYHGIVFHSTQDKKMNNWNLCRIRMIFHSKIFRFSFIEKITGDEKTFFISDFNLHLIANGGFTKSQIKNQEQISSKFKIEISKGNIVKNRSFSLDSFTNRNDRFVAKNQRITRRTTRS